MTIEPNYSNISVLRLMEGKGLTRDEYKRMIFLYSLFLQGVPFGYIWKCDEDGYYTDELERFKDVTPRMETVWKIVEPFATAERDYYNEQLELRKSEIEQDPDERQKISSALWMMWNANITMKHLVVSYDELIEITYNWHTSIKELGTSWTSKGKMYDEMFSVLSEVEA